MIRSAMARYPAASATERIPPDGLMPTRRSMRGDSRRTVNIVSTASGVADTGVLPVDVLMKSAPEATANLAARSTRT